jgi:hypothetical protein
MISAGTRTVATNARSWMVSSSKALKRNAEKGKAASFSLPYPDEYSTITGRPLAAIEQLTFANTGAKSTYAIRQERLIEWRAQTATY